MPVPFYPAPPDALYPGGQMQEPEPEQPIPVPAGPRSYEEALQIPDYPTLQNFNPAEAPQIAPWKAALGTVLGNLPYIHPGGTQGQRQSNLGVFAGIAGPLLGRGVAQYLKTQQENAVAPVEQQNLREAARIKQVNDAAVATWQKRVEAQLKAADKLGSPVMPMPYPMAAWLGDPTRAGEMIGTDKVMEWKQQTEDPTMAAYAQESGRLKAQIDAGIDVRRTGSGRGGNWTTTDDAEALADAIIEGTMPPDVKGLYRMGAQVKVALAKKGFDYTAANLDWVGVMKYLSSANATPQLKLRQSTLTAFHSLDIVGSLSTELKGHLKRAGINFLNKANMVAAMNGVYGAEAKGVATSLNAQIDDLVSELANVYMGGNSPTDHSIELAKTQLKGEWDDRTLQRLIKLQKKNLSIRINSINQAGPISPANPPGTGVQGDIKIGKRRVPVAQPTLPDDGDSDVDAPPPTPDRGYIYAKDPRTGEWGKSPSSNKQWYIDHEWEIRE